MILVEEQDEAVEVEDEMEEVEEESCQLKDCKPVVCVKSFTGSRFSASYRINMFESS